MLLALASGGRDTGQGSTTRCHHMHSACRALYLDLKNGPSRCQCLLLDGMGKLGVGLPMGRLSTMSFQGKNALAGFRASTFRSRGSM